MHIVIVDRDQAALAPLVDQLRMNNFEVTVVEDSAGALPLVTGHDVQFLVADIALLLDPALEAAVRRHIPLARLIALAAQPTLLGLVEALSHGLVDYFPRRPEYFERVTATIIEERNRLARWQRTLLSRNALS